MQPLMIFVILYVGILGLTSVIGSYVERKRAASKKPMEFKKVPYRKHHRQYC
jgi:hypothetical protein